jgi:GNAT superfamily N-acetyltransferase
VSTIRPVTVAELHAHGPRLFAMHHTEVGLDVLPGTSNPPLGIDYLTFAALEAHGLLIALGLFVGDELVGYAVGPVSRHHLTDARVAAACGLFVAPEHRRRGNGLRLMDAFEQAAREQDAAVHWHAKKGSAFERLLLARGARELETVFVASNHG